MLLDGQPTRTGGGEFDGKKAIGAPDYRINLGAGWEISLIEGFTVSARMINTGAQFVDEANTQSIDRWTRFDVGARYVFERSGGSPSPFASPSKIFPTRIIRRRPQRVRLQGYPEERRALFSPRPLFSSD